jgi:uncharacterized membrane protein YcaP (DUF421 family)
MDIALRGIVLYLFMLFMMRIIGRRELASLAPLDLILLIVLGDAIQQGLTQDDYSVTGALIAVSTIALMQVGVSFLTFRLPRLRHVVSGEPIVIVQDGKLLERNLRRERLTADDVAEEARMQQVKSLDEVKWGVLEPSGDMSFIT